MMKTLQYICLFMSLFQLSCHSGKTIETTVQTQPMERTILFTPGPATLVYKTKKDYTDNVPVILNGARDKIVSYPAPSDIYYQGKLAKPTPLVKGYLLDNRGIGANVAFLSYTYEEYSQLKQIPPLEELYAKIIDKSPLTELWNCGNRMQYKDEVKELNEVITAGFPGCKRGIMKLFIPADN